MNTATQLLERCKTLAESALDNTEELLNDHLAKYGENYKPHRAAAYRAEMQEAKDILKDIEAYLAKQQALDIEPVAFAIFTPEMNVRYFSTDKPSAEANASAIDAVLTPLYTSPQAREQVEQEPESFERLARLGWNAIECSICGSHAMAYPKPALEPMSEDDIMNTCFHYGNTAVRFARAIEAHHGIK
jgi:hypothetical protein